MITIVEAQPNEFNSIQDIAHKTWPLTYGQILSKTQLAYMLGLFYSLEGLQKNVADGHRFLLAKEDGITLGFASYHLDYPEKNTTKIPKIYMLPEAQGKGIGKLLIEEIATIAKENHSGFLTLNVNRHNPALSFYQKLGFEITAEEDIELEHGYLMEDYIMFKKI